MQAAGYNVYHASLIYNKNNEASRRVFDDFNLQAAPTVFVDGGYQVVVGASPGDLSGNLSNYVVASQSSGVREVKNISLSVTLNWLSEGNLGIAVSIINNQFINQTPPRPMDISGPSIGITYGTYEIAANGTDPDGQDLWYKFDWGDGNISDWTGPVESGTQTIESHAWNMAGNYNYRVKVKDEMDAESIWSPNLKITVHNRGDANGDYGISVGDAVYIINIIFKGGPPSDPAERADANCDNNVNIGDAVFLINHIFKGGNPPNCL
ncbi:MAG: dockerin type I domain-containing protein [Candidatus Zixiibacteriota bacterium]